MANGPEKSISRHKADAEQRKSYECAAGKVIGKVNRKAYTFRPDVLLTVAVDVANGRIIVEQVTTYHPSAQQHYEVMHKAIESAAHLYCLKERTRLGVYKRDCSHPKHRIKTRRYVVDEMVRNGKVVETIYAHARFCTRCGHKMEAA